MIYQWWLEYVQEEVEHISENRNDMIYVLEHKPVPAYQILYK